MKRLTLLTLLLCACTILVRAQVVDTAKVADTLATLPDTLSALPDTVVSGTDDIVFLESVPVAGNAAMNRLMGIVVTESRYPRYFLEMNFMAGYGEAPTSGFGLHAAYLPKRWGAYAEGTLAFQNWSDRWGDTYTTNTGQASAGVALRPVVEPCGLDWQLFAGPSFGGLGLGYQVGTRFGLGSKENTSDFGWLTGTLAMTRTRQGAYISLGMSIELMVLIGWLFI